MTCALEDAGFEIRDCLMWLYGSGFPKSLDVSKAIDKHLGADREIIGMVKKGTSKGSWGIDDGGIHDQRKIDPSTGLRHVSITEPATPEAEKWSGWGTALKPAYEPIVLARKPLEGTVAKNVLKYGVGGINVDGCRIGLEEIFTQGGKKGGVAYGDWAEPVNAYHQGRWPSNVILDEESARLVDLQSGISKSEGGFPINLVDDRLHWKGSICQTTGGLHDEGGASRFFYIAKASRSEREKGLEKCGVCQNPGVLEGRADGSLGAATQPARNFHPTVKPLELMRYLVRLVTPKDGICLDPFLGSGTTLLACRLEGFNGLGIEKEPTYEPIIRERLAYIPPPIESFDSESQEQEQLGEWTSEVQRQ
jgi:site-specific DNA-methyltransferase (adenine-specific)